MKITIYELLGLVKDGKAPKRIRQIFSDGFKEEYFLDNEGWYETIDKTTKMNIFKADRLNSIVEIIEEEKKIPERLDNLKLLDEDMDYKVAIAHQRDNNWKINQKINSIIDYLKSKGE